MAQDGLTPQERFAREMGALSQTDPEFMQIFTRFAFTDVPEGCTLDAPTRNLAVLSALLGCGGTHAFRALLPAALSQGLTPVMAREAVYQSAAYLGFGRMLPFLKILSGVLRAQGVQLPLPPQAGAEDSARLQAGEQAQADIFGPQMRGFAASGPEETRAIHRWLSENCFGDYYTRGGLDCRQREMVTFCLLLSQGGCEPQLSSHIAANLRLGNDRAFLIQVICQCLPYVGYPRSLNALRLVREASGGADS